VRLVADDRILDLVEPILGPNIALFASHYICKPGGDGMPVAWHQDGSYWPLEPMDVVTAWLAVDDSTVENRVTGAIHVDGPVTATNSTFSNHRTDQLGAVFGAQCLNT